MRSVRHRNQSRRSLAAAARRFSLLLTGIACVTATASLVLGLASGVALDRAVSLGLYLVGSFLLVAGFFMGNRGPVRLTDDADGGPFSPRKVRWAAPDERESAINESAILIIVGLALIVIGVLVDGRLRLV